MKRFTPAEMARMKEMLYIDLARGLANENNKGAVGRLMKGKREKSFSGIDKQTLPEVKGTGSVSYLRRCNSNSGEWKK